MRTKPHVVAAISALMAERNAVTGAAVVRELGAIAFGRITNYLKIQNAVIDVALHAQGRPVSAKTLAARRGLSPRNLESALQALVSEGILKGTRSPRGGYTLARERHQVTAETPTTYWVSWPSLAGWFSFFDAS
jgi:hypothetical protein